ncbi:hypothetical protein Tco_0988218 [Tanacetum coccineum]|uniref:FRIGIDA-like protein n=1 Tax=Tanacetum coccineum TaxID=301880 RepID=A0ABQ5EQB3_9ASTR
MILDAYDSDCDELNSAKIVSCESFQEWLRCITETETDINRDSNIIPYSQYPSETQTEYCTRIHNSSAQQDVLILSMFEQLNTQVMHCTNVNLEYKSANKALTTKLDRYKEEVKDLKEKQNLFELSELRAQSQAKDTVIVKLKEQIKSLKGNVDDSKVKMDMDEIETLNIELEHRVALNSFLWKLDLSEILPCVEEVQMDEDKEGKAIDPSHYRGMIGTLLYLTASRPDLQFSLLHVICKMRIMLDCQRYSVAHWQYTFLGDRLVSWSSKRQKSAAISSMEAEYIALSGCCAQVLWMRSQLTDYGFGFNKIPIFHFIKEHVENGVIELYFVNTEYQLADFFTNAAWARKEFEFLNQQAGCEATFESAYAEKGSIEKPLERKRLLEELGKDSIGGR